jgi:hypothetical protein
LTEADEFLPVELVDSAEIVDNFSYRPQSQSGVTVGYATSDSSDVEFLEIA